MIIFLLFLITYFYPINKNLTQIYQEQVAKADFANKSIRSGLASFIKINNNFFADLKLSLLSYATILPYFYNKDSLTFWNIIYVSLYLALLLPYLKLSSFKSKLRVLSLVPFLGLIFKLINSNQPNQLNLENERKTDLRWYQKLLLSNQVVFKIKLRFIIIYLTLIYIGSMVGFIAFWSYISLTDVFSYLIKSSDTVDNAYSLIYQSLSSNEHILLFDTMKNFVLTLLVAISIMFLIGIVINNDTFLFANAIRKTKVRLVIILVIIELVQVLFIFFAWKYFSSFGYPSDQFDIND
ncbi:putative hypothetical membrane protein domain protein [Mycoplasmoides gallisepticum CA06_2006.052-5-2P]|uniref:Putative hypothetical membrane protein domain protein n=1 Tax=Mycoplasmoides gallisepticum WI01_2001.043-13-2P TaxID=1159201 RepID=J3YHR4_MYCGL|nr:hypothetical protein [Mycoplasmoides gallisepticum]AFP77090.1 putative hypothetical membrane protein domain protein [Mycoplasmoides gallisepticum NC95_13295-2-2P]AFP77848.1 putative hypothetical membrane protein domain protein [Mycoplasmoides gallisepticum NC96_1596-4-2P]AFP79375.1 putative hypothetical membrane protein domain protein [Mycoplasmoides gallisepticum WI01_2001.043-13-2P]AFP80112.1 putative hypothetical membrane protein domain protein [Mycoplasmoides gallisepticum NC06_2006.080-